MKARAGRIEVDPDRPEVRVPAAVLHEICRHAVEADPEECCGLVVSQGRQRFGVAIRCRNEMSRLHRDDPQHYPRDGRSAYHMSERDVLEVRREAERQGEAVTAVYHSHVGAAAYLSDLDLSYADHALFPFPEADQMVISVFEHAVGGQALFRRADGAWAGHRIQAEPQ